jgi:hypothetical protein
MPGSIKPKAGAGGVTNASALDMQGAVSPKGLVVNPGTAATMTMNAAPLSAPAKPPVAISNGVSGHPPIGQPGRSNLRVQ